MTVRTRSWSRPRVAAALALAGCGGGGDRQKVGRRALRRRQAHRCRLRVPPELRLASGPTTFEVANDGADAVTEFEILDGDRILGEVENVASGLSGTSR